MLKSVRKVGSGEGDMGLVIRGREGICVLVGTVPTGVFSGR